MSAREQSKSDKGNVNSGGVPMSTREAKLSALYEFFAKIAIRQAQEADKTKASPQ